MKRVLWRVAIALLVPIVASAADIAIPPQLAIPPQPLGSALQELARQSGIQIIFFSNVVEGRESPALNGTFTTEAALGALLNGSDLTYYVLNDRTIEVAALPAATARALLPTPAPTQTALPEVEITAERAQASAIRAEIDRLEDEFYAEYNKVNPARRYDVTCGVVAPTGSHVHRRHCEPVFDGSRRAWVGSTSASAETFPFPVNEDANMQAYHQNMKDVLSKHPELLAIARRRAELMARYDGLRK